MDEGHKRTDELLADLERRVHSAYNAAHGDLEKVISNYFADFQERDKKMLELLNAGEITEEKYKQWRLAQIGRGERYKELQKKIADRMLNANQTAVAYMNDATPGIYSLNYNYSAYTIEQANEGVDFTLYDEQTVRRLVADDPELWPRPRIDIPADQLWNKQNVRNAITSGILLGESVGKIASRLERVTDMNRNAAIRNARTAVTGAQNAGRQASYERAAEMGIKVRKKWVATIDNRTRHSHAALDGKIVAYNEKFRSILGSEMMYPGDREGKPADVYNCRCTVSAAEKDGIEAEPRMRRVRDPVTGRNVVVPDVTYSEWVKQKATTLSELNRKTVTENTNFKPISKAMFDKLTINAKKQGAAIIRGGEFANSRLVGNKRASAIGDILVFREDASKSDVHEELRHFWQYRTGFLNSENDAVKKEYLLEIDAKKYLIRNAKKFKIPRVETQETKRELE
ncbi:MAG: hypothetical protein II230_03625, partial [Clostridia bacterium]|nr:hypothetical protein [Clostridia bacterium]